MAINIQSGSRIGTPSNLENNGTYDLLMITYDAGFPEGQIHFGLDDTPRKITGIQKVGQTFLKTLLTTKGSDPFRPSRGTNFPKIAVHSNKVVNNTVLTSELAECIKDASSQTSAYLNTRSGDLSSQLASIELLGLDITEEHVIMYLYLLTKSGNKARLAVPFPELS